MRIVSFILRVLLLIGIFAGVGLWGAHAVLAHAMAQGKPEYEVRLASYMAGLFIGGSAAMVAGILMLVSGARLSRRNSR